MDRVTHRDEGLAYHIRKDSWGQGGGVAGEVRSTAGRGGPLPVQVMPLGSTAIANVVIFPTNLSLVNFPRNSDQL